MGNIKIAIEQLEEPKRSIGKALMEFYETMKSLENDAERGGKQATKIVMTICDIAELLKPEIKTSWSMPEVYLGVCKESPAGNTNLNMVWVECNDGLFRSYQSTMILNADQIKEDVRNNYLIKVL